MTHNSLIWISWERQRRTIELSRALAAQLFEFESRYRGVCRYFILAWKTLLTIHRIRPVCLIVQNPSIVLALIASLLQPIYGYRQIVDRHTNFDNFHLVEEEMSHRFLGKLRHRLIRRIFLFISDFTIRHTDLTIITNRQLLKVVQAKSGRGFVLPDKLPGISAVPHSYASRTNIVTYVCTYAKDEPFEEVVQAAEALDPYIKIHITGNHKRLSKSIINAAPENVVFTGYLPDEAYIELLQHSDIIIVLTKIDNCLLCGAYEAVAAERPLIISDKRVLKDYFHSGVLHVSNNADAIAKAVRDLYAEYGLYLNGIKDLKMEIKKSWKVGFDRLHAVITMMKEDSKSAKL
jgi:glycosyltransferase involved in cell wall biosynthesis